ncbi:MAG: LysM peptidoglycan-binding domain-containing protein [Gammaproteobacteria bacterium]|nr:LysM peptidoglycan-binding domain-containing protein [Gammaproteobacteria bacterium]MBU1482531.1 LysM peptidoglycan-binding domain-containing protein [Gammaproteobacteria bacterium]
MRKIISLICLLLPIAVYADELQLQENAPQRYVVVKGDTLWDISAMFFKDPWKWPQIWGYNKDTIADPHWIYPGNVVYLDPNTHTLKVGEPVPENGEVPSVTESNIASDSGVTKLEPRARVLKGRGEAIEMISLKDIGPFLARPLVVDDDELEGAPELVGTYEQRQLLGTDDVAYASNMTSDQGISWQVYRPGQTFKDPETGEMLGHEVIYLGDATVEKFDTITSLRITHAVLEIHKGDRFAQAVTGFSANYLPHAPSKFISARVISIYGGVDQAGQNSVITLNKGHRDGLENGNVLALYQKGEVLRNPNIFKSNIILPDVRYGLVFVFRVFDKVSYALVMQTRLPVQLLDRASTPE